MIQTHEIVDELWALYFWILKGGILTVAWSTHLLAMILFGLTQRLFLFSGNFRRYVERWEPMRPAVFEFRESDS